MDASSTEHTSIRDQKRPRFQLCFSVSNALTTKSDIYKATVKLCGIPTSIITPKFYSLNNTELTEEDEEEIQTLMKKLAKITDLGPREKYKEPILESHRIVHKVIEKFSILKQGKEKLQQRIREYFEYAKKTKKKQVQLVSKVKKRKRQQLLTKA